MKILALDIGDVWTGSAISDALGILARPYQTTESKSLVPFLTQLFAQEDIGTVVVGHPKTMRDTVSAQTSKVQELKETLETTFPHQTWILWDERLSSKRADSLRHAKNKEEKRHSHSLAAAFILTSYLDYLQTTKSFDHL
jgi:putative Holliday junction resolvase